MGLFNAMIRAPLLLFAVKMPFAFGLLFGRGPLNLLTLSGLLIGCVAVATSRSRQNDHELQAVLQTA